MDIARAFLPRVCLDLGCCEGLGLPRQWNYEFERTLPQIKKDFTDDCPDRISFASNAIILCGTFK